MDRFRSSAGGVLFSTVLIVASLLAVFDLGLRLGDLVAGEQLSAQAALWLAVCVLLAFLGLAITIRWVLLNWSRLTNSVEARVDARYKALIEESQDYFIVVSDRKVVYASPAASSALGEGDGGLEELLGQMPPKDRRRLLRAVIDPTSAPTAFDIRLERGGSTRVHELTVNDQSNNPDVEGVIVTGRNVTAARGLEKKLADMALIDELTALPNRRAFNTWTLNALRRARSGDSHVSLLLIDLDGFKGVNDTLGHPFGDRLLRQVSQRLARVCRRGEGLARLGGDEFAIVVEHDGNDAELSNVRSNGAQFEDAQLVALARRVIEEVRAPVTIDSQMVTVSASVGIAKSSMADSSDELFQQADIALYDAKARGRSEVTVFRPEMAALVAAQARLVHEIETGLKNGDFELVYQPLVRMSDRTTIGFESLLRWTSPTLGRVPPDTFIPVAERTGAIIPIGRWVFEESCRQLAAWRAAGVGVDGRVGVDGCVGSDDRAPGAGLKMSVNVSVLQLDDPMFLADITEIMKRTGVHPGQVQVEVTESVLADDPELIAGRLQTMRSMGMRVAIDDFGTGYSSLAQLRHFPVDVLKIDQGFVADLGPADIKGSSLLKALIDIARALDADVVAEGVETAEQAEVLADLGVDIGQGYHFSAPIFAADVPLRLAANQFAGG